LLPIDGTARASVLVCDWDNDGRKDVVLGMGGEGELSADYNWPHVNGDPGQDRGFLFYKNTGTDADPVLDYPKWVADQYANPITYSSRPNLGSYVDWNGDGKLDFISGEFENSIRYYENIGGATGEPVFANTSGVAIVQPFTAQMISGADAIDWNRDGDLDIVTGQGHGGNGLRFYERDFIDDFLNNTYPTVSSGLSERGLALDETKLLADGSACSVPQAIVTASFADYFYVEKRDRTTGIRVEMAGHGLSVGDRVAVSGSIFTNADGERYMLAASAFANGSGSIDPLGLTAKALGGGDWSYDSETGAGQQGVTGGTGLSNIGLLVRTWGRFTKTGDTTFTLEDGSGVVLDCVVPAGVALDPDWTYVAATGISSCQAVGGELHRLLRVRAAADIVPL
jgi:hypothetical protein